MIKSVFDREMSAAGYNSTAFLAWAKRENMAVCDSDKRTKKARIVGNATNCVCIRKSNDTGEAVLPQIDEPDDELPF